MTNDDNIWLWRSSDLHKPLKLCVNGRTKGVHPLPQLLQPDDNVDDDDDDGGGGTDGDGDHEDEGHTPSAKAPPA